MMKNLRLYVEIRLETVHGPDPANNPPKILVSIRDHKAMDQKSFLIRDMRGKVEELMTEFTAMMAQYGVTGVPQLSIVQDI